MTKDLSEDRRIEIEDVKAIQHLDIPLPYGVVELLGENGAGKSTAIEVVEALSGRGDARLTPRRGSLGKGVVRAPGVTMNVGARTTRSGRSMTVRTIESSLNPGDLVSPGIADPVAADAKRIKVLVSLLGITPTKEDYLACLADPSLFARTDQESKRSSNDSLVIDADHDAVELWDPIEASSKIKRICESRARTYESESSKISGEIQSLEQANIGIDLNADSDDEALSSAHEYTIEALAAAEQKTRTAEEVRAEAAKARKQVEAAAAAKLPSLEDIKFEADEAELNIKSLRLRKELLEAELTGVVSALAVEDAKHSAALAKMAASQQRANMLAQWQKSIDAAEAIECPSPEEIAGLRQQRDMAKAAVQDGVRVREAKQRLQKIAARKEALESANRYADLFRKSAQMIESVLTRCIEKSGLPGIKIVHRRIVVDGGILTPVQHGDVFFAELSPGQTWRIVAKMMVRACEEESLISLPQEAWEGLQPSVKAEIHAIVRDRKMTMLTARSDDGKLRAEVFQPS